MGLPLHQQGATRAETTRTYAPPGTTAPTANRELPRTAAHTRRENRFWDAEPDPAERRKLITSLFEHVWRDNGTIVAVKPRGAFADYFTALDQTQNQPQKASPKSGVTKAGATGVEPAFDTPRIEIRL